MKTVTGDSIMCFMSPFTGNPGEPSSVPFLDLSFDLIANYFTSIFFLFLDSKFSLVIGV